MPGKSLDHLEAATRHDTAAQSHDRAARFWDSRGDDDRAQLQREMAAYERGGALLERRWARLVEREEARVPGGLRTMAVADTHQGARRLVENLTNMARALERTAELAEHHAKRHEHAGGSDLAHAERRVAERARAVARRAEATAQEWRDAGS